MKPKRLVRSLVAAGALSLAALASFTSIGTHAPDVHAASPAVVSAQQQPATAQPPTANATVPANTPVYAALPNFTSIVQQQGPAVVNISVTSKIEKTSMQEGQGQGQGPGRGRGMPKLDPDDPLSQFFRGFGMPMPRNDTPTRGQGSGF